MKTKEGIEKINSLIKTYSNKDYIKPNLAIFKYFGNTLFCQCWTKIPENDAMWRIYSFQNKAVRLEIDLNDIEKLSNITAHEIEYVDSKNLDDEIKDLFINDGKL